MHLAHSRGKGRRGEMGLKITLRVVEEGGVGVVKRREPWSLCDLLSPPLLLRLSNQLFPNDRTTFTWWSSEMWSNLATIRFAHSHKRYPIVAKRIGMRRSGAIDNWNHKLSLKMGISRLTFIITLHYSWNVPLLIFQLRVKRLCKEQLLNIVFCQMYVLEEDSAPPQWNARIAPVSHHFCQSRSIVHNRFKFSKQNSYNWYFFL